MYGTKLQKWEQITTHTLDAVNMAKLWCMVQSYKNESKSQRQTRITIDPLAVMYGTKLQKWEQITTNDGIQLRSFELWCMVQSYKNESKSQLLFLFCASTFGCDVWYKVTKMRANHNRRRSWPTSESAVMYGTKLQKWEQITTFVPFMTLIKGCDVWYKVTKMRANHNLRLALR